MRLPGPNCGPGTVAVTISVNNRRPLLSGDRDVAGALDKDLGKGSLDGHARVWVVCFMPDHVHLMAGMDGRGRSLWDYIRIWKGLWTKRLAREDERPFWQRTFYDHWVRKGEEKTYAIYIMGNPVRKGLVHDWREYPFTRCYLEHH